MKRLLMAILLFQGFGLMAQNTLEGKYCNTDTWNWYCFEFYNDSLFKWSIWSNGGGEEITGTYQLTDNLLILNYGNKIDSVKNYSKRLIRCDNIPKSFFNTFISGSNLNGTKEEYIVKKINKKKFVIKKKNSKIKYLFIKNGTEEIPPLKGEKEYCE